MRPGKLKELKKHPSKNKAEIAFQTLKSSIRAKIEHPFLLIKRQFDFVKARYKWGGKMTTHWQCCLRW